MGKLLSAFALLFVSNTAFSIPYVDGTTIHFPQWSSGWWNVRDASNNQQICVRGIDIDKCEAGYGDFIVYQASQGFYNRLIKIGPPAVEPMPEPEPPTTQAIDIGIVSRQCLMHNVIRIDRDPFWACNVEAPGKIIGIIECKAHLFEEERPELPNDNIRPWPVMTTNRFDNVAGCVPIVTEEDQITVGYGFDIGLPDPVTPEDYYSPFYQSTFEYVPHGGFQWGGYLVWIKAAYLKQ